MAPIGSPASIAAIRSGTRGNQIGSPVVRCAAGCWEPGRGGDVVDRTGATHHGDGRDRGRGAGAGGGVRVDRWRRRCRRRSALHPADPARRPGRVGPGPGHHHSPAVAPTSRATGWSTLARHRPRWSVSSAEVDPDVIRRLADAFGVSGDLRTIDGGWQIGADGEAHVRVASAPGASWTYSPGGPPRPRSCAPAPATDLPLAEPAPDAPTSSGDVGVDGCTSTPAPEAVPTAAEAEDAARDLLRRIGLDVSHTTVTGDDRSVGCAGDRHPRARRHRHPGVRHRRDVRVARRRHVGIGLARSSDEGRHLPAHRDRGRDRAAERWSRRARRPRPRAARCHDRPRPGRGDQRRGDGRRGDHRHGGGTVDDRAGDHHAGRRLADLDGRGHAAGDRLGVRGAADRPVPRYRIELGRRPHDDLHGRRHRRRRRRGIGWERAQLPRLGLPGAAVPVGPGLPRPPAPPRPATRPRAPTPTPGRRVVPGPADPAGPTRPGGRTDPPPDPDDRGVVTITSVDLVLAAVPGSDGRCGSSRPTCLTGDDGSATTVLAVDESFVGAASRTPDRAGDGSHGRRTPRAPRRPCPGPARGRVLPTDRAVDGIIVRCTIG